MNSLLGLSGSSDFSSSHKSRGTNRGKKTKAIYQEILGQNEGAFSHTTDCGSSALFEAILSVKVTSPKKNSTFFTPREMNMSQKNTFCNSSFKKYSTNLEESRFQGGSMTTKFIQEKLKQIEDAKKKLHTRKGLNDFYFRIFNEIIEQEVNPLFSHLLSEVRNGIHQQFASTEQDVSSSYESKMQSIQNELSDLKKRLQQKQDISEVFKSKTDAMNKEIETLKKAVAGSNSEVTKMTSKIQEYRDSYTKKAKKAMELEEKVRTFIKKVKKLQAKLSSVTSKEKKAMYLLYLLHSKGHPVTDIYRKEVKPLALHQIDSFFEEDSFMSEAFINEASFDKSDDYFKNMLEGSNISFDPLPLESPLWKQKKPQVVPELNFDEILLTTESMTETKTAKNKPKTVNYKQNVLSKPKSSSNQSAEFDDMLSFEKQSESKIKEFNSTSIKGATVKKMQEGIPFPELLSTITRMSN